MFPSVPPSLRNWEMRLYLGRKTLLGYKTITKPLKTAALKGRERENVQLLQSQGFLIGTNRRDSRWPRSRRHQKFSHAEENQGASALSPGQC